MIAPQKRLWLYAVHTDVLEIVILGESGHAVAPIDDVARMFARVKDACDTWQGFDRVDVLTMAGAVLGLCVRSCPFATHNDPIAEAMLMLRRKEIAIDWDGITGASGAVGRW